MRRVRRRRTSGSRRYGNELRNRRKLGSVVIAVPSGCRQPWRPRRRRRSAPGKSRAERSRTCTHRQPPGHSALSTTRSATSTTSSPGRRPFGKPAASPPMTPRRFCDRFGRRRGARVQAQHLRRRPRSPAGSVRESPVRNTDTRSFARRPPARPRRTAPGSAPAATDVSRTARTARRLSARWR